MSDLSRLVTERLVLTFLNESDIDDITVACQDPLIAAFTLCPSPYTRRHAEEFVHEYAPALRAEGTAVWSIRTHGGDFVGVVDFHNKEGRSAELGYWLAAHQRGHGYMVEASKAALAAAHHALELDFVHLRIETSNEASMRTARTLGFNFHGVLPGGIYSKGTHRDAHYGTLWLAQPPVPQAPSDPVEMVRQFHEGFSLPVRTGPVDASVPESRSRWQFIAEEFCELLEALHGSAAVADVRSALHALAERPLDSARVDTVAATDAVADLIYVLYGMVLETNMPIRQVLAEVHRANMSKLGPDGQPILRADGKVLKGPDYRAPDVASILYPREQ